MNWHERNLRTYNDSAEELAEYFNGIGARIDDINRALELANTGTEANVVEIGCGDGRDAEEIVKRVARYEGVDPSAGLLSIARKRLPLESFVEADALTYDYPENLDVIYAFASLLHVKKPDMPSIFNKGHNALRAGGVYYISLKERDEYTEEVKKDKYGERMFYYYNSNIIRHLAGTGFKAIYESRQIIGDTDWFTVALQKQ